MTPVKNCIQPIRSVTTNRQTQIRVLLDLINPRSSDHIENWKKAGKRLFLDLSIEKLKRINNLRGEHETHTTSASHDKMKTFL